LLLVVPGIFFCEKENFPLLIGKEKMEKAIVRGNRQQDKEKRGRTVTKRSPGRHKYRWKDNIKQVICQMKTKNWIACVQDRGKWKEVVEKAKTFTIKGSSAPRRRRRIRRIRRRRRRRRRGRRRSYLNRINLQL